MNKLPAKMSNFSVGFFISLITSLFIFRGYFFNNIIIGEPFDTRLVVVLHEHWYKFIIGERSFLDAQFFYPFMQSFSLTEIFLLSGTIHAFFRIFGLEIITSWILANSLIIFLGLLGWYYVATKILKSRFLQLFFVPTIGTSYAFIAHLHERPSAATYLLVSWILYLLISIINLDSSHKKRSIQLGSIIVITPLIVLNSWYAGFFLVLIFLITFLLILLFDSPVRKNLVASFKNFDVLTLAPFLLVATLLTILWSWIYLPALKLVNSLSRPISEVIANSPTPQAFFKTNYLGGSLIKFLNTADEVKSNESNIGISIGLIIMFLIAFIYILRNFLSSAFDVRLVVYLVIAGLLIELSIIRLTYDGSFFIFIWNYIEFLKTIRFPARWHIYLTFLIILLIYIGLDIYYCKNKNLSKKILVVLVPLLVLLDQYRTPPGSWNADELIEYSLLSYKNQLNKCDAFILDRPGYGYWRDFIEAMVLTTVVNKPTINGYSGSYPKGYPSINWFSDGDIRSLTQWASDQQPKAKICLLDGIGDEPIVFGENGVQVVMGRGFTDTETKTYDTWNWSVFPQSEIYIYNLNSQSKNVNMSFELISPKCLNSSNFLIAFNDEEVPIGSSKKQVSVNISLDLYEWERKVINLHSKNPYCNFENDPRDLYFSVKNLNVTKD